MMLAAGLRTLTPVLCSHPGLTRPRYTRVVVCEVRFDTGSRPRTTRAGDRALSRSEVLVVNDYPRVQIGRTDGVIRPARPVVSSRMAGERAMSIRLRLLLIVAVTFGLVVVGSAFAAHVSVSRQLRSATDQFLTQRAAQFTRAPSGALPADPSEGFDGSPGPNPNDRVALADPDALTQILSANGSITSSIEGQPSLPVDARDLSLARSGGRPRFRDATVGDASYRILTVALPHGGAAQIARSINSQNNLLDTIDLRLLLIALAGTVLAASLAWVIARRTVRPIEQLTDATAYVARTQDLTNQIPIERRDEIGRLAASFNTMLVALHDMIGALNTSREQQQRLVVDASHELRTPLTAVRTNIEVLARSHYINETDRAELLAETEAELTELTDLVGELVELATDTRAEEPVERVDLGELAEQVVARFQRRSGRPITLVLHDPAEVDARPNMIDRAVSNLVDNALKFSPPTLSSTSWSTKPASRSWTGAPGSAPTNVSECSTGSTEPTAPETAPARVSDSRSSRRSPRSTTARSPSLNAPTAAPTQSWSSMSPTNPIRTQGRPPERVAGVARPRLAENALDAGRRDRTCRQEFRTVPVIKGSNRS